MYYICAIFVDSQTCYYQKSVQPALFCSFSLEIIILLDWMGHVLLHLSRFRDYLCRRRFRFDCKIIKIFLTGPSRFRIIYIQYPKVVRLIFINTNFLTYDLTLVWLAPKSVVAASSFLVKVLRSSCPAIVNRQAQETRCWQHRQFHECKFAIKYISMYLGG